MVDKSSDTLPGSSAPPKPAPAFSLLDADGKLVTLAELLQAGPLVLYFYPKDETPGCTKQACGFRDAFEAIKDVGGQVVGVSRDTPDAHRRFRARYHLSFPLLCDEDGAVHAAYGVKSTLGVLRGRQTFVIDRGGTIQHMFRSQFSIQKHVQGALDALRILSKEC